MPHDLIILLGSQPDPKTWEFPDQVITCLRRSKELLDEGQAPFVVASGKWSTRLDTLGLQQPFRECDKLEELLISEGVPKEKILKEGDSKDTISNLYYVKKDILIPNDWHRIIFVVADFRIPRIKYLCDQILGSEYTVDFDIIKSDPSHSYDEPQTFKLHKEFLDQMKVGDHEWLADKFYSAPMYQQAAENDKRQYANTV
jgi:uncharacterized SAM-binding protein YcdF (DUF218 family)